MESRGPGVVAPHLRTGIVHVERAGHAQQIWQVREVVDSWPVVAHIEVRTALVGKHFTILTNLRHAAKSALLTAYAERDVG